MARKEKKAANLEKTAVNAVKEEEQNRLRYIFQPVEVPEPERAAAPIYQPKIPEIKIPETVVEGVKTEAEKRAKTEQQGQEKQIKEFTRIRNPITNETGTVIGISGNMAQVVYDTGKTKFEDIEDLEAL